jgi:hypothetical protein
MFNPTITLIANALATEVGEMKNLVTGEVVTSMYDGDGGISLPVTTKPLQPVYKHGTVRTMGHLTESIQHDCLKMDIPLGDAFKFVSNLVLDDTEGRLYGVIWVNANDSDVRLNLLHPLIAYCLLHGLFEIPLDTEGTLYLYEWHSSALKYNVKPELATGYVGVWENVLNSAGSAYQPKIAHRCTTDIRHVVQSIRTGKGLGDVKVQFQPNGNNPTAVVTPVHLYTQQMLFPYYGVLMSETRSTGGAYVSRDLTPMGSCNINHDGHDIKNWGSTCTGTKSNLLYDSLRVLCNANTGSPHHTDTVFGNTSEIRTFVKITQEYACVFIDKLMKTSKEIVEEATNEDTTETTKYEE